MTAAGGGEPPILVTGGLGAIGSFVVRRLLDEAHGVVVYSRKANYALLPDLRDRHVLLLDDILDTGQTLSRLAAHIRGLGPASLRTVESPTAARCWFTSATIWFSWSAR